MIDLIFALLELLVICGSEIDGVFQRSSGREKVEREPIYGSP